MVHRVLIVTKFVLHITNQPVSIVFYKSCYHVCVVNLDIGGIGCWLCYWYFRRSFDNCKNEIKVKLDLFNYATKSDLKNAAGFDASYFAKTADLAGLKSDVDKLDIDKLKIYQVD